MLKKIAAAAGLTLAAAGVQAQQPPPAQPPAVCTRADLQAAVDGYVAAQKAGDASKLAFADKAVFKENMADVGKGDGLWNKALAVALSRSFLDATRCKTFTEVIVTQGGHPYVIGTRLYVDRGKITRIDSLVTDQGDWLFNANAYLKYSSKEDWSAPKAAAHVSGQELINAANSYLDMFSDKFVKTPWGRPCARLEGGAYTNRDYVVDEELGVINVFCRFGNSSTGMPDSHTFRLVSGKLSNVHTLSVNLNPDRPSPQADDDGAIVR